MRIWKRGATFFLVVTALCSRPAIALAEAPPAQPAQSWYKGNLHTHSLWSDGNDFPEMIVEWYVRRGYHFLALSDHNILSEGEKWIDSGEPDRRGAIGGLARYQQRFGDWVQTRTRQGRVEVRLRPLNEFRALFEARGKFLLIQGEEITDAFQSFPVHINASNLRDLIRPQGGNSVRETIANNLNAVRSQSERIARPILAHLNHPNFGYGVTAEDLAAVVQERFFEVYNGHPDVNHLGDAQHLSVERLWDIANSLRITLWKAPPLYGMATDDSHNYFGQRGASPGRGWVMVRASWLTPETLIHALERGDFYASSGVALRDARYSPRRRELEVEAVPQPGVQYKIEFIGTRKSFDPQPRAAAADLGETARPALHYGDVGETFQTSYGDSATYRFHGDELYVRAVVTASIPPENPSFEGQLQQAWTQPVGWESRLDAIGNPPGVE